MDTAQTAPAAATGDTDTHRASDTSRSVSRTLRPTPGQRVRRAVAVMTPLAWLLVAVGLAGVLLGRQTGWAELVVGGCTSLALVALALVFMLGRAELDVAVEVKPQRVRAGERSAAMVTATNVGGGRLLGARMELAVGDGHADFALPSLSPGEHHEEVFVLPTVRRAVIPVGPATSVRTDPLGVMRRSRTWTEVVPLFVHPDAVPLAELGTGFIRDLEGTATNQVSQADVAFHTLREYQPGDDRRFIHWLTTARSRKLMVRQFIDTRRSHVAVVVDGTRRAYGSDDEFELAVSTAASLGVRVLLDEQELSMVVAGDRIPATTGNGMLDALSAVRVGGRDAGLAAEVDHLFRYASGLSLALVVTGSRTTVADLRAASVRFPTDVRTLLLRVDPAGATTFQPLGRDVLLTLARLDELGPLLWTVAS
jgi:uncharacterized protein (DUF58 family)